jgi:hypothetical protein
MEEVTTEERPKKKIDTGLLVGLCAIFISVATLAVYIYQARIMQSQQHASVWPYIEWSTSNVGGFYLEVHNKGIGPALIKNAALKIDGNEINGLEGLFDMLLGKNRGKTEYIYSYVEGRVMASGESFKVFQIGDLILAKKIDSAFYYHKTKFEICYCSIYNDCWTSKGLKIEESTCEPNHKP